MSQKKLFLVSTTDKYELPLIIGTCKEVAAYCGTTQNNIRSLACRRSPGSVNKYKVERVNI